MSHYCCSSIGSATSSLGSDFSRWGQSRSRGRRGEFPKPPLTLTTDCDYYYIVMKLFRTLCNGEWFVWLPLLLLQSRECYRG